MMIYNFLRRALLCGVSGGLLGGAASAALIIVDPGGSGDYLTIQEGIDAAVDGDTIVVNRGTYREDLIVPVSVTIAGAGVGQSFILPATSVPGSGGGSQVTTTTWLIRIQADGVIINGFTLNGDNPALAAPIDARGGIITDYSAGTFSGTEVVSCQVKNVVYRAINLAAGGSGHRIVSNSVSNAKGVFLDSAGITLVDATGMVSGNTVDDCSIGMGFQSSGGGDISANVITNCDLGILVSESASPVTVDGNSISTSGQGIQVIAVDTTVDVDGNTLVGNDTGVALFGSGTGSTSVDGNTIDGEGGVGSAGLFASTDAASFGFGDLTFVATNNLFTANDFAVVLSENLSGLAPILSGVLSGSAATYNTFSGSLSYNVYLEFCDDDLDATHNIWGSVTPALIEQTIHHQVDDPTLGLVDFSSPTGLFITVDDDGPADFTTINPAVQALLPGGTIVVSPGLYVEDVLIDRSCLIQGSGTSDDPLVGTVLRGFTSSADLNVVEVVGPDVFIDNLRVDGQQPVFLQARRAIYGNGTSGLSVTNCVVHTARSGIVYASSTDGVFLDNEVYEFGENVNSGGGIFLWDATGTVGLPGQGNWVHDGAATAVIFHNGSAGVANDNLAEDSALGYLSNGASAPTLFEGNVAKDCTQGYQALANNAPVTYVDNDTSGGGWGFSLFGLGGQLHTYTGNRAFGTGIGWFISTDSIFGDDDAVATYEGNMTTENDFGIVLDESAASQSFLMDVNLNGEGDPNFIQRNALQDLVLQGCDDDIDAVGNYFGMPYAGVVETQIYHQEDDPLLGRVTFTPLEFSIAYCEPKLASPGCLPSIGSVGVCRVSTGTFDITATDVVSEQFGFMFYGFTRREAPFWGGTLCLKGPLRRTQVQMSGGTGSGNCTGTYSYRMSDLVHAGKPGLDAGVSIYAQYWFRDPALGGDYPAGLTDALSFTIGI